MRGVARLTTLLLLPVVVAGLVFLSLYYTRQVDFILFRSLSRAVDIAVKKKEKWQGAVVLRPGGSCNSVCRIWTEPGSLTRITVLDQGLLVLYGSCDITIFPKRRRFWSVRRGRVAFFPRGEGVARSDRATRFPPFEATLFSQKCSVDQGRTLILKLVSEAKLECVRGRLDRRLIRFFTRREGEGGPFYAIQGVDVFQEEGIRRLSVRAQRPDGVWLLQSYPFRVNRRRYFPTFGHEKHKAARWARIRRKRNRWSRTARIRFWRRWRKKKNYILKGNRPYEEWKRLQKIYTVMAGDRLWKYRFGLPIRKYDAISSPFGKVRYLTTGGGNPHRGVDYAAPRGRAVIASARGEVVFAARTIVRGGLVILSHGMGVYSTYMHLSRVIAVSNRRVFRGQLIGRVGSTGLSTGPHLHFGIRVGNVQVDPAEWMRWMVFPVRRWYKIHFSDDVDDCHSG